MRFKRFILPKILLVVGVLALFLIVKYQSPIKEIWSFNLEKLKIHYDNFFYQSSPTPKRKRPISLIEKETELKLYIGEPFTAFTLRDWNWFWNLVYGAFPKEEPPRQGLPKRMRQLTADEVAFELMQRYPEPFTFFQDEHWQIFFSIIFKK